MKVYISGKITGLPIEEAKANFKAAEERLIAEGYECINPMELKEHEAILNSLLSHHERWIEHMKVDVKYMMECDTIAMLQNWVGSKGANIEYDLALKLGFTIYTF
jgi:hypothetical protein